MAKTRDITEIKIPKGIWKPKQFKPSKKICIGFDTETKKDGYAFIMAEYSPLQKTIHKINSFDDLIELAMTPRYRNNINWFFNLDFDFTAIAKYLGENHLHNLAIAGYTEYKGFQISWFPRKQFTISIGKRITRFFDIQQFYNTSLKKVGEMIGVEKLEFDVKNVNYKKWLTNPEYKEKIETYCLRDAEICQRAAEKLHTSVNKVISCNVYFSTASISQRYVLSQMKTQLKLPKPDILDLALKTYAGGRFEIAKRGFFDKVWSIDRNSAYPKEFSQLPDISNGKWYGTTSFNPESLLGFYLVKVKTNGTEFSPVMKNLGGVIVYPHGKNETYMEKSEIELLERMGFDYTIIKGYEYFNQQPNYPFKFFEKLYDERLNLVAKGEKDLAYVFKIISNAAYGKTIQLIPNVKLSDFLEKDWLESQMPLHDIIMDDGSVKYQRQIGWKAGLMFNPIYATTITARMRSNLLNVLLDHNLMKKTIGFATDSIFLNCKPPIDFLSNRLGDWKLEADGVEGIFVGSGVYNLRTKGFDVKYDIRKMRGFTSRVSLFDALFAISEENNGENGLGFADIAPVRLKEGMKNKIRRTQKGFTKIDWHDIGKFLPRYKMLDLNFDVKRKWNRPITKPLDLLVDNYNSKPLIINI